MHGPSDAEYAQLSAQHTDGEVDRLKKRVSELERILVEVNARLDRILKLNDQVRTQTGL